MPFSAANSRRCIFSSFRSPLIRTRLRRFFELRGSSTLRWLTLSVFASSATQAKVLERDAISTADKVEVCGCGGQAFRPWASERRASERFTSERGASARISLGPLVK